jgi:hypothetical protein
MRESEMSLKSLHLDDLPEFDPPADLWPRIAAAYEGRRRSRRRALFGTALAAGIALLAIAVPQLRGPQPIDDALAALQRQSRALEVELADLSANGAAPIESEVELRAIETALQAAYDRGGADAEIAPLWQARNDLLSSLIAVHTAGGRLTRI